MTRPEDGTAPGEQGTDEPVLRTADEPTPVAGADGGQPVAHGDDPPPYVPPAGVVDDRADVRTDDGPDEPAGRRRTGLRIGAAVLAVALIAAALTLAWLWRGNLLDERAREQALTAARQSALNLTSIDQEDFDGDVGRVLDGASGEFRTDFSGRVAQLQQLVEENEVTAEGRVLEAGLVRADRESATALVVVDSRIRNTAVPEGRVNSYRMRLELEKVGDDWRTSSLEFVG